MSTPPDRGAGAGDRRTPRTAVLLVRHGQSTWNAEGRWQGQADPPLTDLGERQAAEASARVGHADAVWTSDLRRARRTAEIVARAIGAELHADEALRERHAGPWQGLTRDEIETAWPGHLESGARPPGYEPDDAIVARALAALDRIASLHAGASVVVVSHGGVIRVLERHLGSKERGLIPNLSGRRVRQTGLGAWELGEQVLLVGDDTITVPRQI